RDRAAPAGSQARPPGHPPLEPRGLPPPEESWAAMSNSLAIAAATATLRNLIFRGVNADLAGTDVTTRPPDRARANITGNQVNLFLYLTTPDAALRNMDTPGLKAGETGKAPLPLVLHYLVSAYPATDHH